MLQIFHQRRKGTIGAAFLALLLVVSAWPCPQNVEAEGQQAKSPRVVTLNDAEVFKKRTDIASLNLSSKTSGFAKIGILEKDPKDWMQFKDIKPLSKEYLDEMAALLSDYRKLAGIENPQVDVVRDFEGKNSQISPQSLAFINMCMGESSGNYHHNYLSEEDGAQKLLAAINKAPETAIPAEQKEILKTEDSIYNRSNLLQDGSVSSSLLTYEDKLDQIQKNIVNEWNNFDPKSPAEIQDFRFVNGFPLDNLTAKGPINGWIQEGYDYHYSTLPDQRVKPDLYKLNLGHRAILLQSNLKTLRIGAVAGKEFQVPAHYIDSSDPDSRVMQSAPYLRYNAAGWTDPEGENKYFEKAASVIAFPAPGVFPLEFINPQCTVWTLELNPEVYKVDKSKLKAEIREYSKLNEEGKKMEPKISLYKDDLNRPILAIEPPASQTGKSVPQGKATAKDFPSVYNLAPLEGKTYVVTLTGVKDKTTGEDITIQYWVQYRLINSLPTDSDYYLSEEKAGKISAWVKKILQSASSNPGGNGSSGKEGGNNTNGGNTDGGNTNTNGGNTNTNGEGSNTNQKNPTPQPPAPQPNTHDDDTTTSKGPQLPPPPKPGGSSSKYGRWNQWNKDGKDDEDDDESDTLFGSKYSHNRRKQSQQGPQSQQLRFQGPMAAPQGPGNQFPAGQLSGQPSPMPLAPQNMGQGVNPQAVNQAAPVNAPVAANNALQYVPETGEQSFQPWVLGALLGAVALILAKRRKI